MDFLRHIFGNGSIYIFKDLASTARHFPFTKKSNLNGRSRGRSGCGIEARTAGQTGAAVRWLDHSGLSASSLQDVSRLGALKNKALAYLV